MGRRRCQVRLHTLPYIYSQLGVLHLLAARTTDVAHILVEFLFLSSYSIHTSTDNRMRSFHTSETITHDMNTNHSTCRMTSMSTTVSGGCGAVSSMTQVELFASHMNIH